MQTTTSTESQAPVDAGRLPEKPIVVIAPSKAWRSLDWTALWAYRELLYFLSWRDVMIRYKQTLLGAAWAVLQPLMSMLIFTLFFGKLAKVPSDGIPYPLFAYAGLLPWTFFSNAVTNSSNSLVGSANLISKVYFPRVLIPAASICAGLVDYSIAFAMLAGLMIWYRVPLTLGALALLPLTLLTTLLALAVGMWTSCLNVKYRDIRYALPFVIQLWMFASPIIYPSSLVPMKWRWVLSLNPMAGLIEGYRSALFNRPEEWGSLGMATAIVLAMLIYAAYSFRHMEREFADII
jgi:homopolymeric O-antigen transport system permease protein